jgi:hypothetical protein
MAVSYEITVSEDSTGVVAMALQAIEATPSDRNPAFLVHQDTVC